MRAHFLELLCCLFLLNCKFVAFAADPSQPEPIATASTFDLSEMPLNGPEGVSFATVTFSSGNLIAVRECSTRDDPRNCQLAVFRWDDGRLERTPQVPQPELKSSKSSADGSRRLLDFNDREVPRGQRLLETLRTVATLGMAGPEDVNREVVQVVNTSTRKSCFEFHRSFAMTNGRPRTAAISPSGDFVVIAAQNTLSVYRLATVCDGVMVRHNREE